jgi:hypothetical protein
MKMKQIVLKFEEWLIDQQYREDSIGDLARIPIMQKMNHSFPKRKSDEHKNWVEIVVQIAQPGWVFVFNDAWQEFLLAKQAVENSPD